MISKIRSLLSNPSDLRKAATAFGGTVILTSAVVTSLLVGLRQLGALEGLELQAYDLLIRSRPDEGPDNRLLVVGITEEDIQKQKEYPISDGLLAKILAKLEESQPRAIGIDILRDVPQGQGRAALIDVLKKNDNIIAACKLSSANEPGNPAAPGVPEERIGFADLPLDPDVSIRGGILVSTPTAPKTPGNQHLCNIADPNNQVPSLSFLLSLLYLEPQNIALDQTEDGELKLGSTVFKRLEENAGGYHKAGTEDYRVLLNYRSAQNAAKQVTITEVLEGKVDPALIKDRVVMVGYLAQSANDDFSTPYSPGQKDNKKMPGVVIHAQSVSQILSATLNNRPLMGYWPQGVEILWILGWSVVGGTLAWSIRRPWIFGLAGGVAIAILVGSCYGLFLSAVWVPLVPPALALVGTALGALLIDRYAQAIVESVKGVLKLNIEINQDEKESQVAEITESEYFKKLQEQAKQRRNQKKTPSTGEVLPPIGEVEEVKQPTQESEPAQESEPSTEGDDYFQQLQRKGKRLRKKDNESID
jgi:adenylate cyclase